MSKTSNRLRLAAPGLTGALTAAILSSTGCAGGTPTHVVFYQKSVVGIDLAPAPETGNVHLVLGYDRKTVAFVPTATVTDPKTGEETTEAMSVVGSTEIVVPLFGLPTIAEAVATGEAAKNVARNQRAMDELVQQVAATRDANEGAKK